MLIIELPETAKFRGLYKITNIKMLNQFPVSLFPSDISFITLFHVLCHGQGVLLFSLIKYPDKGITYEKYKYPAWAEVLGWFVAGLPMFCIPAYATWKIFRTDGNLKEVIDNVLFIAVRNESKNVVQG